jgi:MoxR-like ATPase
MRGGTAVVGSESELTHVAERVTDLLDGTGRAILIEGEPGIGKSTLARGVIAVAVQHGCQIYKASSDELGQELPLQPLLDALGARESAGELR